MKNTFYLVRHGESEFNSQKRHQGWTSGNPLTKKGVLQVEETRSHLAQYPQLLKFLNRFRTTLQPLIVPT